MERLWSQADATGGNRWQIRRARKWLKQAETVAAGCDQLPGGPDGKEGVDGSSPSEGSAKSPHSGGFCGYYVQIDLLVVDRAVGMELFMELSRRELA